MGALLPIRLGVPSKLREPSAAAVPRDGPDRLAHGGDLSTGRARAARSRPAIAGSLSAGRGLRTWAAQCHRASRSQAGSDVGETLSASGEPPAGASSGTRATLVVHLSALSRSGRHQPRAERAIRGMVIARKVWGGNRTWVGSQTQQILVSVLRTCWQQGKDAFVRLVSLLRSPSAETLDIVPGAGRAAPPHNVQ